MIEYWLLCSDSKEINTLCNHFEDPQANLA